MLEDSKISYVEMPGGTDLPAVKAFYAAAFGWRFVDYGPSYASFEEGGVDGGFDADPDTGVKTPLIVLFARDLEAMEAKVVAAGGVICRPIFAFPGGRRFHFTDPAGNELAVFTEE
jgi:predicted enzyme related to lactoylglutathione lyase